MSGQPAGRSSRREWGWHPLTDAWARRIVDAADIGPHELVVDIGAGTGALTRPLLAAGARVLAVELHPGRVQQLRALAESEPRLTVVLADATDLRLPRRPFRVVASPPYAGSSAIIDRLLAPGSRLVRADLVVQSQLARRYVEGRAPAAHRWQRHHDVQVTARLPRAAFRHPPRVDSVVLRVVRRAGPAGRLPAGQ